jgi:hypothetical protein
MAGKVCVWMGGQVSQHGRPGGGPPAPLGMAAEETVSHDTRFFFRAGQRRAAWKVSGRRHGDQEHSRGRTAYVIYHDTDVPRGEADALAAIGTVHRLRGRSDEAIRALSRAVDIYQQIRAFAESESVAAELETLREGS